MQIYSEFFLNYFVVKCVSSCCDKLLFSILKLFKCKFKVPLTTETNFSNV